MDDHNQGIFYSKLGQFFRIFEKRQGRPQKPVKLVGVKITLQAKRKSKKSRTVQPGFQRVPYTNILEILNGSTFL